jgi:hypothetical protein
MQIPLLTCTQAVVAKQYGAQFPIFGAIKVNGSLSIIVHFRLRKEGTSLILSSYRIWIGIWLNQALLILNRRQRILLSFSIEHFTGSAGWISGTVILKIRKETVFLENRETPHQRRPPQILQSDNGKEFVAEVVKNVCNILNIKIRHGRPRHPQSQGQVERLKKKNVQSSHLTPWIILSFL